MHHYREGFSNHITFPGGNRNASAIHCSSTTHCGQVNSNSSTITSRRHQQRHCKLSSDSIGPTWPKLSLIGMAHGGWSASILAPIQTPTISDVKKDPKDYWASEIDQLPKLAKHKLVSAYMQPGPFICDGLYVYKIKSTHFLLGGAAVSAAITTSSEFLSLQHICNIVSMISK